MRLSSARRSADHTSTRVASSDPDSSGEPDGTPRVRTGSGSRAALDRHPRRQPSSESGGKIGQTGEPAGQQQARGDRGAGPALAVDYEITVSRDLIQPIGEPTQRDVSGSGKVAAGPLRVVPHVEDNTTIPGSSQSRDFNLGNCPQRSLGLLPGHEGLAAEVASDPVQPDQGEVPDRGIDGRSGALVDDEIEVAVIREEPPGPSGEAAVERDIDGAGCVAAGEVGSASEIHDQGSIAEQGTQPGFRQTRRTAKTTQNCRTQLVQSLHLAEIARRIGLARENLPNEFRLFRNLKSPVEKLLIADRGLRHGAHGLAAR